MDINSLVESAYCETEYENGGKHCCYEFSKEELSKYTALIVEKCAEIIEATPCFTSTDYHFVIDQLYEEFGLTESS